jgi:pimeloyl-ACP methyl ester carboxylesterase
MPKRTSRILFSLFIATLALWPAACSTVQVHRVDAGDDSASWRENISRNGSVAPRTLQDLHQWDLDDLYQRDPVDVLERVQRLAEAEPRPERLYAAAEISYLLGERADGCGRAEAVNYYYLCAGFCYHYLFSNDAAPSGYDPRFRLACEYYNRSLSKCLRSAQHYGWLDPGRELQLPATNSHGVIKLQIVQRGFTWRPDEFGEVLFCSDYRVTGLENQYHHFGLGVPLIGMRKPLPGPVHAFYPHDVSFPMTAFMRFEGTIAELSKCKCGQVELYNPLSMQTAAVRSRDVPLESDISTPLAYCLSHTKLNGIQYEAFLRADRLRNQTGIYLFEPYQPGKIPVLMVHGLFSSPLTWAQMFNELRADPALRDRFQFWFYLYPTSDPYLATAATLRRALTDLRAEVDPGHLDPAMDRLVLVGHSMGGLVSKLLTVDSGDGFWRQVSLEPFDSLKADAADRSELQQVFFFEPQPCVRRVIFMATPHHGSSLSPSFPARLLSHLARLSQNLMVAARDLQQENPGNVLQLKPNDLPTSIDLLAPGSPALHLLAAKSPPPGVHYHSVIGVLPDEGFLIDSLLPGGRSPQGTDGVVPFSSAHIEGVESELVVPADHLHVHWHPRAVEEVRRILLEHAAETSVQLASHESR